MLKVGDLIKHLSSQSLDMSPAVMTLQNYLKNSFRPEENFDAELLQSFLNLILEYPHWRQSSRELTEALEPIFTTTEFENIKWPQDTQIIELQSPADHVEVVQNFLKRTHKNTDKCRVVYDGHNNKSIGLVLSENGTLTIRAFNSLFVVRKGLLEPLRLDLTLKYNDQLELVERSPQLVEIAPYTYARFIVDDGLVFGSVIRGYIFQKSAEFKGLRLENYPKLFFALKRLEQFFIRKESDPYYKEMIHGLEKSILNIKMNLASDNPSPVDVLARAQSAHENVFVDDKLLQLLIRDLQVLLEGKPTNKGTAGTPKQWHKQQFDLTN